MRTVIVFGVALAVGLAVVFHRSQVAPARRVVEMINRDDWFGARRLAAPIASGEQRSRAMHQGTALHLVGVANLVLGDLRAAQRSLEQALVHREQLPATVRGAVRRQLASAAAMSGRIDDALVMLDHPSASEGATGYEVETQRALVLLMKGEPGQAAEQARRAIDSLDDSLSRPLTHERRAALTADQLVARAVRLRALVLSGDLRDAEAEWEARLAGVDADRPYVRAGLAEAGGVLAHARGRTDEARHLAAVARTQYKEVGAAIDVARSDVLRARVARDATLLRAAEQSLVALGARGYLGEVEAARSEIGVAG